MFVLQESVQYLQKWGHKFEGCAQGWP